ncbi:MAG: hypothetical protein IJD80_05450 [Oscillospiraceae bacterium]|nr:hypothetical protein [Oscillospiraceae bacterium]
MNERLKELSGKVARKQKTESALESLYARKDELLGRIYDLQPVLEKEERDVTKLENFSLSALLHTIAGTKEEQLEKERREAYTALVRLQNAEGELNAVNSEIDRYTYELRSLAGCEDEYKNLLDERMKSIMNSPSVTDENRVILEERAAYLAAQEKEISEAIRAGNNALHIIDSINKELSSAKNWSTLDMLGGDLISTLAKQSKMSNSQIGIYQLQNALTHFRSELTDITVDADIQIATDDFLSFADFWFDGLLADFMVHDKINQTIKQVARTQSQIRLVISKLEEQQRETSHEKQDILKKLG